MGATKTIGARIKVKVMMKATVKMSILIVAVTLMKITINYVLDIITKPPCLFEHGLLNIVYESCPNIFCYIPILNNMFIFWNF